MRQRGIASGKGSPQARGSRGQKKLIAKGDHQYGKDNFFLSCGLPSRLWLLLAVALYVLTPLFISYSSNAQRALTYLNYAAPPFSNLSDISSYLGPDHSGRAFFVNASQSGQIGTWHVYPKGEEVPSLSNGKPVVVYFHGNAGNRGLRHRVGLYKVGMPAILLVCKEMCNVLLSQRTQSQWCLSPQLQHSANQIVNLTIA
eukprot:scpid58515/ scgid5623/ 